MNELRAAPRRVLSDAGADPDRSVASNLYLYPHLPIAAATRSRFRDRLICFRYVPYTRWRS